MEDEKKDGIVKKTLDKATKLGNEFLAKQKQKAHDKELMHLLNSAFEQKATSFIISSTGNILFAIKEMSANSLLIRLSDSILCRTELHSGGQIFEIIDFDTKITEPFRIEGNPFQLDCYRAKYEVKKTLQSTFPSTVINQNVTVGNNNSGDINLNAVVENQLSQLLDEINKYKPLNPSKIIKKQNTLKMYGNFKNCILTKQKDEVCFDKFKTLISDLLPALIPLVTAIIASV